MAGRRYKPPGTCCDCNSKATIYCTCTGEPTSRGRCQECYERTVISAGRGLAAQRKTPYRLSGNAMNRDWDDHDVHDEDSWDDYASSMD